jgi:hypothetical protein
VTGTLFYYHRCPTANFQDFDKVLQNRNAVSPVLIGKFCCASLRSFPKWRISQDDIKTILVLKIAEIFCQRVGVDNIQRINAKGYFILKVA